MRTIRYAIGLLCACALLLASTAPRTAAAAEAPPEEVLKAKGLTKSGQRYLLFDDAGLAEWLRMVRASETKVREAVKRRTNLERDIRALEVSADNLYATWKVEKQKLAGINKKADITYNKQVDRVNGLRSKILAQLDDIKKRTAALRAVGDPSDEHVTVTVNFGNAIDATIAKYKVLAADAEVRAAIDKINKAAPAPGARVALGPSERLVAELPEIAKLRERVNTDTINFDFDGGVPTVPVLLNGTVAIHAIVDSGAAAVTISDKLAKQLNLAPEPGGRKVHMVTADGTVTEVDVMILKSVRLGKFTVENVECLVQPPSDKETTTLLGGTFLRRFVYRMDLNAGQLKLSMVGDKDATDVKV